MVEYSYETKNENKEIDKSKYMYHNMSGNNTFWDNRLWDFVKVGMFDFFQI